ncbi:MAG: arginine deiminase [bacterium P3]|nr:MAG: arginine deiminase [bacterium P3]KWW42114.1 MAG: arginine deiminase [bacterium F083]
MSSTDIKTDIKVNVNSEYGLLKAVLLHTPGQEIERMTPENAHEALYSDILNKSIVDGEYANFSGVLERWTQVYYVADLLERLLSDDALRRHLVEESCRQDQCLFLLDELLSHDSRTLAHELISGFAYRPGVDPGRYADQRYILRPLYNLFFTRDASSSVYNSVLINSMSFDVRQRETLIYQAIFEHFFGASTLNAMQWDPAARTEGGDVQVARHDLLCVGCGIRTNRRGIDYLAHTFGHGRERFHIIAQELPHSPDSFIHLDMVFTFLGPHTCMAFEPMLKKTGLFAGKSTTLITVEGGRVSSREYGNILQALSSVGMDVEPLLCGGGDAWAQQREQWHSGANFFALGPDKVIGYRRNNHTIETLDKAGFAILPAEDICSGKIDMKQYDRFVAAFQAGELPRAGGGARCMTMPVMRETL